MTTNNTEAIEETDETMLQVRIVNMSSEEKKRPCIQDSLKHAAQMLMYS